MRENLIGSEISTLRKDIGITVAELAHMCGVSRTYIGMVEKGVSKPTKIMKDFILNKLNSVVLSKVEALKDYD